MSSKDKIEKNPETCPAYVICCSLNLPISNATCAEETPKSGATKTKPLAPNVEPNGNAPTKQLHA